MPRTGMPTAGVINSWTKMTAAAAQNRFEWRPVVGGSRSTRLGTSRRIGVARIFSGDALFFPAKVDDFFSRRPQKHGLKPLNNHFHCPDLPNFLKKWTALPWGCMLCLGVHLQLSPINLSPPNFFFSALNDARAPGAPPGYAYVKA